ncbi:selenoprotein L isoform X2 [Polyodon spathula]|uniref:selenoprotein L isoform X2 n=1 Tax=Polyodon spathula TaxID=7913 RepID=UPI001B7EA2B3|nr:selenoprotein L isoform X2 [Polyodon spathula]
MAEERLLQKDGLVKGLEDLVISGRQILENAIVERRNGSLQDFSSKKISLLLGFTDMGAHFLSSLSVKTKTEAEELWKKYFHDVDVRDHVEDLLQLEMDWNEFVEGVDSELNLNDNLHGENLLDAVPIRVLVISFGCREGGLYWLQDTGFKYDMLLDQQREMYHAFGLGMSIAKVWSFSNMFLYAEYKASKRQFPRTPANIKDNIYQLGGDFVLDEHGKVIYFHPSENPSDRPSVTELLNAIGEAPKKP